MSTIRNGLALATIICECIICQYVELFYFVLWSFSYDTSFNSSSLAVCVLEPAFSVQMGW